MGDEKPETTGEEAPAAAGETEDNVLSSIFDKYESDVKVSLRRRAAQERSTRVGSPPPWIDRPGGLPRSWSPPPPRPSRATG